MLIDCNTCAMRDIACHNCVVTHFLAQPTELATGEAEALSVLHEAGFVPPMRMTAPVARSERRAGLG
jgi:hypothetical protein